jgi:glycogen debranching enzyme
LDTALVAATPIHAHVASGFTPLFAGVPTRNQAARILENLNQYGFCPLNEQCYAVPSYDKQEPDFGKRYWRGPIWMNLNWLLYRGLRRYGFDDYAARVQEAMVLLPQRAGFYEYFDPDTGSGHGSNHFSWSAALLIDLLADSCSSLAGGAGFERANRE